MLRWPAILLFYTLIQFRTHCGSRFLSMPNLLLFFITLLSSTSAKCIITIVCYNYFSWTALLVAARGVISRCSVWRWLYTVKNHIIISYLWFFFDITGVFYWYFMQGKWHHNDIDSYMFTLVHSAGLGRARYSRLLHFQGIQFTIKYITIHLHHNTIHTIPSQVCSIPYGKNFYQDNVIILSSVVRNI